MRKNVSIKARIRALITQTVLLITVLGCFIVVLFFLNLFNKEKENIVEKSMKMLYTEAVTDTINETEAFSKGVSDSLIGKNNLEDLKKFLDSNLYPIFPEMEYILIDSSSQIYYTTSEDIADFYQQEADLLTENGRFMGNETSGIWYLKKTPILDNDNITLGYLIVASEVTKQDHVEDIKSIFGGECTLFYRNIRVATTIQIGNETISGTKLDQIVANKLLAESYEYIGTVSIIGEKYMAAYESFGNPGEEPIGIIFAGESIASYNNAIIGIIGLVTLFGIAVFIVAVRLSDVWLEKNVVKPMIDTTNLMTKIANGDISSADGLGTNYYYNEFGDLETSLFNMIHKIEESKKETERIAYYDDITGLFNRFYLFRKIAKSDNFNQTIHGFIMFDIDGLNTVNNLYGRKIGDDLLVEISRYIKVIMEKYPMFVGYRIGGGTFLLLLDKDIDDSKITQAVEGFMERFIHPFVCGNNSLQISISMGISVRKNNQETFDELFHHAELAMFEVKKTTKNAYRFYVEMMSDKLRNQKEKEEEMQHALDKGEFFLVYQPKFNLLTNQFDSLEALIRWNSSKYGFVSPGDFIELAEQSGMIVPIGKWVLKEACRKVKQISEKFQFPYVVSVNISPNQINREDFFNSIMDALIESGVDSSQLELEITENLLIKSLDTAVEKLRQLCVIGANISVDDFGKGYSSLAYLKELPIHTLKIDKMFIDDIEDNETNMVCDIINIGHNLDLKIVAEGVETENQANYLRNAGCDSIQGYYYSKPLNSEQLDIFLNKNRNNI